MKTVILCGGSGTRLWPISRKSTPKQFAKIFDGRSLYQKTLERNLGASDGFIIIANKAQLDLCKEQTHDSVKARFLTEGVGRNTAPAIAMAALASDPEEVLLVVPSDHLIKEQDNYEERLAKAKALAQAGNLVTFGMKAKYPETGYGYIEADGESVLNFKEKPDLETAKKYVESGNYYWNSGMFCFKAKVFLEELKKGSPEIYEACISAARELKLDTNGDFLLEKSVMAKIPADSIDYAVMEKSSKVKVALSTFYWSDLGSFDSLYEELPKDENGNSITSKHFQLASSNNLVLGGKRVIATFDVNDLIIVDTEDALLVGKRGNGQRVKEIMSSVTDEYPELAD